MYSPTVQNPNVRHVQLPVLQAPPAPRLVHSMPGRQAHGVHPQRPAPQFAAINAYKMQQAVTSGALHPVMGGYDPKLHGPVRPLGELNAGLLFQGRSYVPAHLPVVPNSPAHRQFQFVQSSKSFMNMANAATFGLAGWVANKMGMGSLLQPMR